MIRSVCYILVLLGICTVGCGSTSGAGAGVVDGEALDSALIGSYNFVDVRRDTVCDSTRSLAPFYEALGRVSLARIANGSNGGGGQMPEVVSIVHYGDSHVQGGVLPQTIMRHFARKYGSAGRGMVVPHKLSRKNEPRDYAITSPSVHTALLLTERGEILSRGVSGVSVAAPAGARYNIRTLVLPDDKTDYRFSRVVVFHDSLAPIISAAREELMDESGGDDIFRSYTTLINLLRPTDSLDLVTYSDPPFSEGAIYGFSLENDSSGVIYHSMGVNGACFTHWGRYDQIARQSEALNPQLIIVSLGSNEASGANFDRAVFLSEVDSFVSKLRAANPAASILLVSPPEAMRRVRGGRKPNDNFEHVSIALQDYAKVNGLAFFDLYRVTGGRGSSMHWLTAGLLARDGLHYTPEGYALQGVLIYRALQNSKR